MELFPFENTDLAQGRIEGQRLPLLCQQSSSIQVEAEEVAQALRLAAAVERSLAGREEDLSVADSAALPLLEPLAEDFAAAQQLPGEAVAAVREASAVREHLLPFQQHNPLALSLMKEKLDKLSLMPQELGGDKQVNWKGVVTYFFFFYQACRKTKVDDKSA